MRLAAFCLLAVAAFDAPVPWLDRAGAAVLGLAFLALAVGASATGVRRSLPFGVHPATTAGGDNVADGVGDLVERLAGYGGERR